MAELQGILGADAPDVVTLVRVLKASNFDLQTALNTLFDGGHAAEARAPGAAAKPSDLAKEHAPRGAPREYIQPPPPAAAEHEERSEKNV